MSDGALLEENKALRTKVYALEQELKQRTEETTALRAKLREFAEIKQKTEIQSELIAELRGELEVARVAHASALEALENIQKKTRDREHMERIQRVRDRLDAGATSGGLSAQIATHGGATAGGVVPTTSGTQIVYKSSDISSLGFSKQSRPIDFLGGIVNPLGGSNNARCSEEEGEVDKLMEMVKDDVLMDVQYADITGREERELQRRLEALKRP